MAGYDIIGDVHGCASELVTLLGGLGYRLDAVGVYRHPERTAVFVGDLVDRGPGQREVLRIVKAMADAGTARVSMGNHEFNAICYATKHPDSGEPLRPNNAKNAKQHKAFIEQLTAEEQEYYLQWFKTLPLWLDLDGVRVVHACWHKESMRAVEEATGGANRLTELQHYVDASTKGHPLYDAVETLLKGPEIDLEIPYLDKGGHPRTKARMMWWKRGAGTLRELADVRGVTTEDGRPYPELPDTAVDERYLSMIYTDAVPVVYGHYWFQWEKHREDWTDYTACVDFSAVAAGHLVAYRWDAEPTIVRDHYVPHTADVVAPEPSA